MSLVRAASSAVILTTLAACGATPLPATPPTSTPAATAPTAPTPTPSTADLAVATPTPTNQDPGDHGTLAKTASASSAIESFPSGLVVDQAGIGGPAPGPELPKGTRVLHVGDSFAGALGIELNKVLANAGVKGRLEFEKSTYIPTWAHNGKLGDLVARFKPDLVLISLGANELENPEPEKRGALIQKIVKLVGNTPCVWIAPVLWEGAKGALLDVIRSNVGGCVYLDSNRVIKQMPRAGDRIHPSMAARPDWAAATARWLAYHRKPQGELPWSIAESP